MHNRLAEFRHLAGISQENLATVTGVSVAYIRKIESNKSKTNVTINITYKLAKYFNTDIETLFDLDLDNINKNSSSHIDLTTI